MTQVTQIDIDFAEKFRRGNGGKYDRDVSTLAHEASQHRIAAEARGMEKAAKIADDHAERYAEPTQRDYDKRDGAIEAATAIRAALNGGQSEYGKVHTDGSRSGGQPLNGGQHE